MTPSCSLSILVSRPDIAFMRQTVPHLVRSMNYPFLDRLLIADTAPLSGSYARRTDIGSLDDLRACCAGLVADGVIDRVVEVDHKSATQRRTYQGHFSRRLPETRDYRGCPSIARVLSIEEARGDYVACFDSDLLLYEAPGHSWIAEGIKVFEQVPDVMFVAPRPGPPRPDGGLRQGVEFQHDPRGFFKFNSFSSRDFLIDRRRFARLLPIEPGYVSWKRRLLSALTGASALQVWEVLVSEKLGKTHYFRADLDSPNAWTLHAADHGLKYLRALPGIIANVEKGLFPPAQAGDYDLSLDAWAAFPS